VLILFLLFCSLLDSFLSQDTRIIIISTLNQGKDSLALLFVVLFLTSLVLCLHVSFLISIGSLICVVLVEHGELSPGLEIGPPLVELLHLSHGSVFVTKFGHSLFFVPSRV